MHALSKQVRGYNILWEMLSQLVYSYGKNFPSDIPVQSCIADNHCSRTFISELYIHTVSQADICSACMRLSG